MPRKGVVPKALRKFVKAKKAGAAKRGGKKSMPAFLKKKLGRKR